MQPGDIVDKKRITTNNAVEQYLEIAGIYGTSYIFPIKITKKKLIVTSKLKQLPKSIQNKTKKQPVHSSQYYEVGGRIYKYNKLNK